MENIFLIVLLAAVVVATQENPATTSGILEGQEEQTSWGTVTQYLGVPYAQPPVGVRRFALPQPLDPNDANTKIRTVNHRPRCIQSPHLTEVMYSQVTKLEKDRQTSEDCLYLNVYVPKTAADKKKPVVIWVPGEGFSFEDGSQFDLSRFSALNNVIGVTVNYRVGVFGFLSAGTASAPGNAGVWDVLEAIRWVSKNAAAFGGDATRITLAGRFTGSMIVSMLLTSDKLRAPSGKPLIRRVIMESGVAGGRYVFDQEPLNATSLLAAAVNCPTGNHDSILQCLRDIPADSLHDASWTVPQMWRPIIDGKLLITDPLVAVKKSSHLKDIEVMIGEADGEGSICLLKHRFLQTDYYKKILDNTLSKKEFLELTKENIKENLGLTNPTLVDAIVHEYQHALPSDSSPRDQFINMCSFMYTRAKVEQFARLVAKKGAPVYRFEFAHRPSKSPHPDFMGAAHGDSVIFMLALADDDMTEEEKNLQQLMARYLGNFIKTGDPNSEAQDMPQWPLFTDDSRTMIVFTADMSADYLESTSAYNRDVAFWNYAVPSIHRNTLRAVAQGRASAASECVQQLQGSFALRPLTEWASLEQLVMVLFGSCLVLLATVVFFLFYFCRAAKKTGLDVKK